ALEVAQRFRSGLADAGVLVLDGDDVLLPLRLNPRQRQLLTEDVRQFFERQIDLEDVPARLIAGAAWFVALRRSQRLTRITVALPDAAGALLDVTELR